MSVWQCGSKLALPKQNFKKRRYIKLKTENLSTLKIHKLSQVQYERERDAGRLDPDALYLTPDDGTDIQEELDKKASLYVGSGEMPEGYDIQIDPDSEALIVPIESGGTGATTAAAARENLGVAPAPIISQTDITAGTTELTSGTTYLVYE